MPFTYTSYRVVTYLIVKKTRTRGFNPSPYTIYYIEVKHSLMHKTTFIGVKYL